MRRANALAARRHAGELEFVSCVSGCGVPYQLLHSVAPERRVGPPLVGSGSVAWVWRANGELLRLFCQRPIHGRNRASQITGRLCRSTFSGVVAQKQIDAMLLTFGEHLGRLLRKHVSVDSDAEVWKRIQHLPLTTQQAVRFRIPDSARTDRTEITRGSLSWCLPARSQDLAASLGVGQG